MTPHVGFCVLYRFRVRDGEENDFVSAWAALTHGIREQRGGLGSRLHRDDDGTFVAYAQWPDRATWQRAQELPSVDPDASERMGQTLTEGFAPILLTPEDDLLERLPASPPPDGLQG